LKTKTTRQQAPRAEHEERGFQKHPDRAAGGVNGSAPTDFKGGNAGLLLKGGEKKKSHLKTILLSKQSAGCDVVFLPSTWPFIYLLIHSCQ